ncbi:hypothetical protein BDB00DRAFT_981287 [Zychaea mexicana]|uniref:uncharacterized protein n=1 Tax=Zychaea mexicana TaxID=64656 RepID=UPI0022FE3452|nr:uncharacterized protein BDB00DRAFT_981287 [Zychaea mexicana]KAI9489324.1 hypothetical protein BDB00DRAFT_981287 [Zychaea mexicana]
MISNQQQQHSLPDNVSLEALLSSFPGDFAVNPLVTVTCSSGSPGSPSSTSSSNSNSNNNNNSNNNSPKRTVVQTKKSRLSLDDKDQKTKERILRNRAAAQESRDKKRRYVVDLEARNKQLQEENERVTKRAKTLEAHNQILSAQLLVLSQHFAKMTDGGSSLVNDGFCDSARIAKRICVPVAPVC